MGKSMVCKITKTIFLAMKVKGKNRTDCKKYKIEMQQLNDNNLHTPIHKYRLLSLSCCKSFTVC